MYILRSSLVTILISVLLHRFAADASSDHIWMKMCPDKSPCCRVWQSAVKMSNDQNLAFLGSRRGYNNSKYAYDNFEPSWNCDLKIRVPPKSGDGPKWMCGPDLLSQNSLVYSFGSRGEISFESDIASKYTKNVFIFDPTVKKATVDAIKAKGFNFIEVGLLGRGETSFTFKNVTYPGLDLISHMKALGHTGRLVDVLKVDIEGSEYATFKDITVGECPEAEIKTDQIEIEVHGTKYDQISELLQHFMKCNMRIFSKERNAWGCDGYRCLEFSLVSPSHALRVFKTTHPSCDTH